MSFSCAAIQFTLIEPAFAKLVVTYILPFSVPGVTTAATDITPIDDVGASPTEAVNDISVPELNEELNVTGYAVDGVFAFPLRGIVSTFESIIATLFVPLESFVAFNKDLDVLNTFVKLVCN
jgi:hypothetical protein